MEHHFWHTKWGKNEIGFHEPEGNAHLVKYAHVLLEHDSPRVFVPLCGKTKDIAWLLSKECDVVGAELSELAVQQLFEELGVVPTITKTRHHLRYEHANLVVFVGDIFNLQSDDIGLITGIYDRAALVALPEQMRNQYSTHLSNITHNAPMLIVSFEYNQSEMAGPPFSVSQQTVKSLYSKTYTVNVLEQSDMAGGLKGRIKADNLVFSLTTTV